MGHGNLSFTSSETADGILGGGDYLMALLGAPTSTLLPHSVKALPFPIAVLR